MRVQKETTSYDGAPQGRVFGQDQLAEGGPQIEVITAGEDIQKLSEDTAFMHEMLTVVFLSDNSPNATKLVELGVNTLSADGKKGKGSVGMSVRKGYDRNKKYQVPRYLVEVAAHAKIVTLEQVPSNNPNNPEMMNVERVSYAYPFSVVHDPNPKGRAWLEARLNDPA